MGTQAVAAPAGNQPSPQAINAARRQAVLSSAVNMRQLITSQTISPQANPVVNFAPRNVGLLKRFVVTVLATIANTGAQPITLTDTGLPNILTNVTYTDLNNYQRISTTGLHLSFLASSKRRGPYGAAYAFLGSGNVQASPFTNGDATWPVFQAPQTIAPGATGTLRMIYEIPLAFSDKDLRGAIFANVINATQTLGLTVNQNPVAVAPGDTTSAVYSGPAGSAGAFTSVTFSVYQEYLDQLPSSNGQLILPSLDLSTVYELKTTNLSAITQNQDFYIPFSNMRDFHSVFAIYNNNGTATGRTLGADVNYWALRAANMTDLWKVDPLYAAQLSRDELTFDLPAGCYYFPSREKPISTSTYGNMQLVLNSPTVAPGANVTVYWEDFGLLNTLTSASSLS